MIEYQQILPARVIGPMGEILTLEALPDPQTIRWTIRRKAEVVAAVEGELLTFDEALERYALSLEEITAWRRSVERSGLAGLRATQLQHYRDLYERKNRY